MAQAATAQASQVNAAKMVQKTDDERLIYLMDHPDSTEEIPIIDMGPYLAGEPGADRRMADELRRSTETVGFFYLKNHSVPQSLIDRARFGANAGNPLLGAADYRLVHHASNGRSVYSFCMCPGGTVVAAASEPGRVVTNGMSQYSHDERNANAGIVVGITPEDFPTDDGGKRGPLAGVALQRHWESRAYELGGSSYEAPGQLVG